MNVDPQQLIDEAKEHIKKSTEYQKIDKVFEVCNAVVKLTAALEAAMAEIERLKDGTERDHPRAG